jgi:hypothetical protein
VLARTSWILGCRIYQVRSLVAQDVVGNVGRIGNGWEVEGRVGCAKIEYSGTVIDLLSFPDRDDRER